MRINVSTGRCFRSSTQRGYLCLTDRFDQETKRVFRRGAGRFVDRTDAKDRGQNIRFPEGSGKIGVVPRVAIDLEVHQTVKRNGRTVQAFDRNTSLTDIPSQDGGELRVSTGILPHDLAGNVDVPAFRDPLVAPRLLMMPTLYQSKTLFHDSSGILPTRPITSRGPEWTPGVLLNVNS